MEADGGHLCWDCMATLDVVTDPFCAWCGDPIAGEVGHAYTCSRCAQHPPAFDCARSAVSYRGPIRNVIQSFKYSADLCLSHDMVGLLQACAGAHVEGAAIDGVCWVPLYPVRERKRGFNQARVLAAGLARRLRLRLMPPCLERLRNTESQTGLSRGQRRTNVKGAFRPLRAEWVQGRVLLLVDDVMTTGATVSECARVLKQAGAAGVHVLTVARG
jgi:ComF family protein